MLHYYVKINWMNLHYLYNVDKKFENMIKKTCQYILNVVPHIFSSIKFCVRTLVFFIIEETRIFWRYVINRFFYNQLSVFRTNFFGIVWNFINRLLGHARRQYGILSLNYHIKNCTIYLLNQDPTLREEIIYI